MKFRCRSLRVENLVNDRNTAITLYDTEIIECTKETCLTHEGVELFVLVVVLIVRKLLDHVIDVADTVIRPVSPTVSIRKTTTASLTGRTGSAALLSLPLVSTVPATGIHCSVSSLISVLTVVEVFDRKILIHKCKIFLDSIVR